MFRSFNNLIPENLATFPGLLKVKCKSEPSWLKPP